MEQAWLANGTAVLVLDRGEGEPTIGDGNNGQMPNPDYRPALVAVLATEYHEPGQVLDSDPLADADTAELTRSSGATTPGIVPGELRGPIPAPHAAEPGAVTFGSSADVLRVVTAGVAGPGTAVSAFIATIRDLEARADAGDADAQRELSELRAFADTEEDAYDEAHDPTRATVGDRDRRDATGADVTSHPGGDRTAVDVPETAPGGTGVASAPAAGTGAGDGPATA